MHIHFLDPYKPGHSLIHELNSRVKLLLAFGFILTVSLTPAGAWPIYILLFALVVSTEILSGVGAGQVLKRSALAAPFVLAALPLIFTTSGAAIFTLPIGAGGWQASDLGIIKFLSISMKSWISVQAAILLAMTTPFPDMLAGMRELRLPRLLVAVIGLMWRYLFILADEALRLNRARASRTGRSADVRRAPGDTLSWRARVTGGMAGSLFLRSLERSDRVYLAMVSRGYDGEVRTLPGQPASRGDRLALVGGLVLLSLLFFFGLVFYG